MARARAGDRRVRRPADQRRGAHEGRKLERVGLRDAGTAVHPLLRPTWATRFGNMRIWKEKDAASQEVIAWHQHNEWQAQERTIWMDGRPHPPEWAPHTWQGFSTGDVGRQHAGGDHDPPEDGVSRTQWRAAQRRGDAGRALHAARQRADDRAGRSTIRSTRRSRSSALVTSCAAPNQEMNAYPCRPAVEIDRAKHTRAALPAGDQSHLDAAAKRFKVPADRTAGRRGNHVSGIPAEVEGQ